MEQPRPHRSLPRLVGILGSLVLAALPSWAPAQTHKVASPQTVVRAVGVYEWTGDMAKPVASRLIPISLFIDGHLQDAGVYLASPIPMSVLPGNVYQLQRSGVFVGDLDLAFARHLIAPETASTTYDDGWFGYGKFVPPALVKKSTLKGSAVHINLSGLDDLDSDDPHFSSRSATPGTGGAATPIGGVATSTTSSAPADDPDRPTLHRASTTPDTSTSGSNPADDPDRPTLRRRSPQAAQDASDRAAGLSVTRVPNTLNDDPDRPILHRGKPISSMNETDIPKLSGLPADTDLHQMVAVSDATDRPPHNFARPWDDDTERQTILTRMQSEARTLLTAYEAANTPKPAPRPHLAARHTASRAHKVVPPPTPPPTPLLDEKLTGYTLSYGGAPTFVYQAHTSGLGAPVRYVTVVAQVNMNNLPEIALTNVTDADHLDRTPRMKLIDVVDAQASNRASLLFELRAQNSRQFALYRILGARATQIFLTGSSQ